MAGILKPAGGMSSRLTVAILLSFIVHLGLLWARWPAPTRPAIMQVALPPVPKASPAPELPDDPAPLPEALPEKLPEPEPARALEHDTRREPTPQATPKEKTAPPPTNPSPSSPKRLVQAAEQRALSSVAEFLVYPEIAIQAGHEGTVLLRLRLGPQGEVLEAAIARSSGHTSLDQAALTAIRRAGKLNAGGKLEFILPFTFQLQ